MIKGLVFVLSVLAFMVIVTKDQGVFAKHEVVVAPYNLGMGCCFVAGQGEGEVEITVPKSGRWFIGTKPTTDCRVKWGREFCLGDDVFWRGWMTIEKDEPVTIILEQ
jgi:hypothetical protein